MSSLEFNSDDLLEHGRGNHSAVFYVSAQWAKTQADGLEGWATFIGQSFAPSWDELEDSSALDVARNAGRNFATTADMSPVDLSGDASSAVLTVRGPEREWCEEFGVTVEDIDRSNELIYAAIAERRGLALSIQRTDDTLALTFTRRA